MRFGYYVAFTGHRQSKWPRHGPRVCRCEVHRVIETLEVIPDPVSLIEAMRAVGYTAEAAVADIIDNSLSAGATEVQVKYDAADVPFVAILDDGHGMSPDELTNAMRHGSGNAADRRDATDLGRFGLGPVSYTHLRAHE